MALLLAIAFLPAGAIAMHAGLSALAARQASIQEAVGAAELQSMATARDGVTQLREAARTLAVNADLFTDNHRLCRNILANTVARIRGEAAATVLDSEARIVCSSIEGAEGRQTAALPLINEAKARGDVAVNYVGAPRVRRMPRISAVAPVSGQGDSRFFIAVSRPAAQILAHTQAAVRPSSRDPYSALVAKDGDLLALQNLDLASSETAALRAFLHRAPLSGLTGAFRVKQTWAVATAVEPEKLYLVRGWRPALTAPALLGVAWALIAPILLWGAAVAAVWLLVEMLVTRPLLVVENLSRAYARGEATHADEALLRTAPREIADLRRALAAMAKTLRGRESRLAEALREERALLRELNHRVKNNLQMVASILSIQARATGDPSEARGLGRAQDRVQLLAQAHARIYNSGALHEIPLDELAADIVRTLTATRGADVRLTTQMDPIRASSEHAVPFAFLIGESLSHVLDMAYGDQIAIDVRLMKTGDKSFILEIVAPQAAAANDLAATTLRIIDAFARQIGAQVERDVTDGVRIRVEAALPPPTSG
ncbi:MAG: sensor histidine kinase [Hyphomonadaceae bacterium]